jgi:hypothetical protein
MEIPRNSVFNSDEIFVVRQGRLVKEQIEVIKENDRTLLFSGIPEGDTVVVQQLINVSEGTLVQTDKDAPAGPGPGRAGQGQGQSQDQGAGQEQSGEEGTRANR